jgi:hypothetical protein
VDVPDPLTLPLHDTAIVATAVITLAGIVRWFQAQRHLTAGNADAVGVLIARRVAGHPFHEVDAGFGPNASGFKAKRMRAASDVGCTV